MSKHANGAMKLNAEDITAYKANWAASAKEATRLGKLGEGAKLIINGKRVK
jgi:hypothetical protein